MTKRLSILEARVLELESQLVDAMRKRKRKPVNVRGGSKDPNRGKWCTSKPIADAVGPWDLDAFSNPRSHIVSAASCMLERGDDGFGDGTPGSYLIAGVGMRRATAETRFFGQPPYEIVMRALKHYEHTRFCFLLRFDPRTEWFKRLYRQSRLVCVLRKCEFEPPPGVPKGGGNSFPHAIYYRNPEDVTPAVLRKSIAWKT